MRADGKASIILAGSGIGVGAVLAGLIAGDVSLSQQPWFVWALAIGSVVGVSLGIALIALAVYPRVGTPMPGRARYFTEIGSYDDKDELRKALKREEAIAEERDLDQLRDLSTQIHR